MKFRAFVIDIFKEFCEIEGIDFESYSRDIEWLNPIHSQIMYGWRRLRHGSDLYQRAGDACSEKRRQDRGQQKCAATIRISISNIDGIALMGNVQVTAQRFIFSCSRGSISVIIHTAGSILGRLRQNHLKTFS